MQDVLIDVFGPDMSSQLKIPLLIQNPKMLMLHDNMVELVIGSILYPK
jgi:hypothetical protein